MMKVHIIHNEGLLHGFLHAEMKVPDNKMQQLQFDRIHRMGTRQDGRNRPIIAKCSSTRTKDIIFQHVKNLKGSHFGVSEQYPQEVNERRNFLMTKFKDARAANLPTKWKVDKLIVNGNTFSQAKDHETFVHAKPSTETGDFCHTNVHQEKGSSFQGHVIKLDDKDQVIPSLHKLFSNHNVAKATHNMYAYRLNGKNSVIENSNDDGEFGAGNKLIKLLREQNQSNVMVVVTRWYGGMHLGPQRFKCILKSATDALTFVK